MPYATKTKTKAINALEGMRQIVRREMVTTGEYVSDEVLNPRLTHSLCGGRKHCAIGSLWVGAGIKPKGRLNWDGLYLPGTGQHERKSFLRGRPGLRLALDALNTAAEGFAAKHDLDLGIVFRDPIEGLFENHYGMQLTKLDLLKVISDAKRYVKTS